MDNFEAGLVLHSLCLPLGVLENLRLHIWQLLDVCGDLIHKYLLSTFWVLHAMLVYTHNGLHQQLPWKGRFARVKVLIVSNIFLLLIDFPFLASRASLSSSLLSLLGAFFFFFKRKVTTRKIMVTSEARGWGWRRVGGCLITGSTSGGAEAVYSPEFSKGCGASRGHQWRSFQALPYQSAGIPPYFLNPNYREGTVNSH